MKTVTIDFYSDYICPWCYIGKTRLERIKKDLQNEIELDIVLKPFLLYPHIPQGGIPKAQFASRHVLNGVEGRKPGMGRSLKFEAALEGIETNYKHIENIPNSLEAHRLTWLINDNLKKYSFAKRIFKGYFEKGKDIENQQFLVEQALQENVNQLSIDQFINSNKGQEEVTTSILEAKSELITLVPSLKLIALHYVPGLQEYEVWVNYIRRAAKLSTEAK